MVSFEGVTRRIKFANRCLFAGASVFLLYIIAATVVDVLGRYFHRPFLGSLETNQIALACTVYLAWGYTQAEKGHISIDVLFARFSRPAQGVIAAITSSLTLCAIVIITWRAIAYVQSTQVSGLATDALRIPLYPFMALIVLGGLGLCCQLALDIVASVRHRGDR